jgi:hypothetical protein
LQRAKSDLQYDKVEGDTDEPPHNDEYDQGGRCSERLSAVAEIRGKPGTSCSSNEDDQTVGKKNFIEYRQAEQRSEDSRYSGTCLCFVFGMDHSVISFHSYLLLQTPLYTQSL